MTTFPAGYPYPPLPIDFGGFDSVAHIDEEIRFRDSYVDLRTIYPCDPSTGRAWAPFKDWAAWEMRQLSQRKEVLLRQWSSTHCDMCQREILPSTSWSMGDTLICGDCGAQLEAKNGDALHARDRLEEKCLLCFHSSKNSAGPVGKHICWHPGAAPDAPNAPGAGEVLVADARAPGKPCGPDGALFEDCQAAMWDLEGKDGETWQCLGW